MTHLEALEAKLRAQADQITVQRLALEDKNRALDALHYVWCAGGCSTGVHRYDSKGPEVVTEAVVRAAVVRLARILADDTIQPEVQETALSYVSRLISWHQNHRRRQELGL